ncbi:DUF4272 domain-containing protein [Hymenobacter chitinivorans]|uniref:Uncharacterized protein DUF4272 n=1 Tax=Hymenobacter chitinivorans DSM 11115 TaxID=1121954 RepID=A0A2M9ASI2_9BACT|nr:DUF4272 domain-containing protein [Hymenobacter chitinivorans]PJJ48593.1 uncharacterized protein DUF4272 [Hymenobacter chitinivorans DSM 11115]
MTEEFKFQTKTESEGKVLMLGGRVCDWLPILDTPAVRAVAEVQGRMSVLNALIYIGFQAPVDIIRDWLTRHDLLVFLSAEEEALLQKDNAALTEQELINLRWSLESLWALMWATGMTNELQPTEWCGDDMATMLPDLERNEDNAKLAQPLLLRPTEELYRMLDYYYRLHWYCVDERLNGREAVISESLVYERRKALEWVFNRAADWDNVEMST